MLRVAIVGCGKIADAHAAAIETIDDSRIVAVCDHEELMARQLYERYRIDSYFSNLDMLLDEARPHVVHITTPPHTHFDIAKHCLERGCHVYVEKPFTLCEKDAAELIYIAEAKGLRVTAGHDDQFSHVSRRLRSMVKEGYLGDRPYHLESYYCYQLKGAYIKAILGDRKHWVRKLPGQLLQNIISHGVARIAEYLSSDNPDVVARGFTSGLLKNLGEDKLVDELRVIISEEGGTTAYFTFSSQIRPDLHQFRIYGSRNGLILDEDNQTLIRLKGTRFVSYVEKFVPPVLFATQYLENLFHNARLFVACDFHMKAGMKFLIDMFYRSVREGTSAPIPYKEILQTARIMDRIFEQVYPSGPSSDHCCPR